MGLKFNLKISFMDSYAFKIKIQIKYLIKINKMNIKDK